MLFPTVGVPITSPSVPVGTLSILGPISKPVAPLVGTEGGVIFAATAGAPVLVTVVPPHAWATAPTPPIECVEDVLVAAAFSSSIVAVTGAMAVAIATSGASL